MNWVLTSKWRVVFTISDSPSEVCIEHNLNTLADMPQCLNGLIPCRT